MSLFKLLPSEIPDNHPKISVGIVIRKCTTYLNEEFMRTIKELAPMNNLENKKNTLQILIREFHNAIKKLHRFLKNARNFPKISKIDKLSLILYEFNLRVSEAVNQNFYTNEMCKFYRLPSFNMEETIRVLNNNSHSDLKMKISSALNQVTFNEKKENIFYFMEKFYYEENLKESDITETIQNMKKESISELNILNSLINFQNIESKEFVRYKNDQIIFQFGEVSFKLVLFSYQFDNNFFFSYFCQDFTLSNNQKYFIKVTEGVKKYLPYLNNNLIYPNIKIEIQKENSEIDLQLNQLQNILRDFTYKYIYKNLFKQLKIFIREFYNKKIKLPIKITQDVNELKMSLNYEIKSDSFFLIIKSNGEESNSFILESSHSIVNENPFIIINNFIQLINFNQIGKINLEKVIFEKLREFEKIHLFLIHEKCKKLKSLFIPFKILLDEENSKIKFYLKEKFLIFSLITDRKGNFHITDDTFIFKSNFNTENNVILKSYMIQFLKFNFDEKMNLSFNEFIFKNFIEYYFYMNKINLTYKHFNSAFNQVSLEILLQENNILNKRIFLNFNLSIECFNKFVYSDIEIKINNLKTEENVFLIPIEDSIIKKELKLNKSNILEKYEIETLNKIIYFVNYINITYDDFFRNVMEGLNFVNKIVEDKMKLKIDTSESFIDFEKFIEKENLEIMKNYVKSIEIQQKNLIFKINLNSENFRKILPQMNNYSLFDNDNIINFLEKECAIVFYFLTKINLKVVNDFSYYRRFFVKIFNKLLNFMKKILIIINSDEMRTMLNDSENVLISPIGIQFKYNFFNNYTKTVLIQFFNIQNHEKKNLKCLFLPLEYHFSFTMNSFDMLVKLLQDSDENNFLANLNNILFISYIYNLLNKKFGHFIFPIGKNIYDVVNSQDRIFVIVKDHKTFHIIKQNKLSIYLEIINTNKINIMSSYLWNPENCIRFLNSISSTDEIQSKTQQSNTNHYSGKLLMINKDTISLLNDLEQILDFIHIFS